MKAPEYRPKSVSVNTALEALGNKMISAAEFATVILSYYNHSIEFFQVDIQVIRNKVKYSEDLKAPEEWIRLLDELFNIESLAAIHALIGLCLLDNDLFKQFNFNGYFQKLINGLNNKPEEVFTEKGFALYNQLINLKTVISLTDYVQNQSDYPIKTVENDILGRSAFARFLAKRIDSAFNFKSEPQDQTQKGAYCIHLYGAWGSGKSSVLNLLKSQMEETLNGQNSYWKVVEFNAWRNQHLRPPWWTMIEEIYNKTKSKLNPFERISEVWWRFKIRKGYFLIYIISLIILSWLAVYLISYYGKELQGENQKPETGVPNELNIIKTIFENLDIIIAGIISIWGLTTAVTKFIFSKSLNQTEDFIRSTHGSMNEIENRFNTLVNRIRPYKVIILIDDLDRCNSEYVVELLEGIQTICKSSSVVFVIAADARWINACFEKVYSPMKNSIIEPGKSLGTLFLEKTFQLSTVIPSLSADLIDSYWLELLSLQRNKESYDQQKIRSQIRTAISRTSNPLDAKRTLVEDSKIPIQLIREEIAVSMADARMEKYTEHQLRPFSPFLEPNPRSIKRLVNGYNVNRALLELAGIDLVSEELAFWTILMMRWPKLALELKKNPGLLDKRNDNNSVKPDDEIKELLINEDVTKVIFGEVNNFKLNRDTIKKCSLLI